MKKKKIQDQFRFIAFENQEWFSKNSVTLSYEQEKQEWIFEYGFGSLIFSQGSLKVIWYLSYIYNLFYANYLANVPKLTPYISIDRNSSLFAKIFRIRIAVENLFQENLVINDDEKPRCQNFCQASSWFVSNKTANRATQFMLFHEYSHSLVKSKRLNLCARDEEDWCDSNALSIYQKMYLKNRKDKDLLISKMGLQLALLVINTVAIDLKNFGVAHSASYDRIIKVFDAINQDDDDFFCLLAASLMFECDLLGLHVTHDSVYDNFKDVVDEYRNLLKNSRL